MALLNLSNKISISAAQFVGSGLHEFNVLYINFCLTGINSPGKWYMYNSSVLFSFNSFNFIVNELFQTLTISKTLQLF